MIIAIPGIHFAIYDIVSWIIIGGIAGYLASKVISKKSYGCLGNIIVGLVGVVIGGFLASFLNISGFFGYLGTLVLAFIGACIFLFFLRLAQGDKKSK